jgi:hypothetical protein
MKSDRGIALILGLLVLSFLTVIGCALLTTAAIDLWISDNYKSSTQNLYLAEAGIDQAREILRTSSSTPTQLLSAAAGQDGQLQTSADLATLLASDDQPLLPGSASLRLSGQPLIDSSGRTLGHFYIWLRNDSADGISNTTDTNNVLRLLSIGQIGSTRKTIEAVVQKGKFPALPGADIQTDQRLTTVTGLENLVASITKNANDVFKPANGGTQTIMNYGNSMSYRVAVINGDVTLGPGTGYGILLARGAVTVAGNFTWNGLILIIGKGILTWNSGTTGLVHGGVFVAQTLAPDGTRLASLGQVTPDLSRASIVYDAAAIKTANQTFPYSPIAIIEK